jgi:hypothetical protein
MKILRALAAIMSGILLYSVVIYVTGYLAAIPIPKEYFLWFGKPHVMLALAIFDSLVLALPKFLIALFWSVCTLLIFRKHYLLISTCCIVGCVLTQAYWDYKFDFGFNYVALFTGQPWTILNMLAVPCGIYVAGFILYKLRRVDGLMR